MAPDICQVQRGFKAPIAIGRLESAPWAVLILIVGSMKFPAKLGIAKRLYCVLAILVASLTGLASFSWSDLSRVSDLAAATEDLRVPQLQRIAAIELNVIRASLQIRHAMLVKSPEDLQATLADIGQRRQLIEKSASDYRAGLTDTADLNDFKEFEKLAAEFWPIADTNVALAKRADIDAAFGILRARSRVQQRGHQRLVRRRVGRGKG